MNTLTPLPTTAALRHPLRFFGRCCCGLVSSGEPADCPECLWHAARGYMREAGAGQEDLIAVMDVYLRACERMLPPELRHRVREVAAEGNWYALRFVRNWKRDQVAKEARP